MKEMPVRPSRRHLLRAVSVGIGSAVSGCLSSLTSEEPEKPKRSENAPPLKWISTDTNNAAWKTPRLHGQTLYSSGYYHVRALDVADGSERWRYRIEAPSDTPCYRGKLDVAEGVVYTAGCNEVYAFGEDGQLLWTADDNAILYTPPTISEEALFFGGYDLVRIDRPAGNVSWERDLNGVTWAPPVIHDEYLLVGLSTGTLAAYDRTTGNERFRLESETDHISAPVVNDGVVFAGTFVSDGDGNKNGYLCAAGIDEERWLWCVETGKILNNLPPAVHDDTVFVINDAGTLYAIATIDGSIRWTFETSGEDPPVPRVGGDLVYVASGDTVYAVDRETGEERWYVTWDSLSVAGRDSPPLITANALYVGTISGMYAFDLT